MRFEAPKGTRLHRYFWGVTITDSGTNLWWNHDLRKWEPLSAHPQDAYGTHAPCRTLRAFKRMLRKFPELEGKVCLVNRYIGYDVYA